ncbi:hypothetical protein bcgnr5372_37850 [Bacillus luti]|nr:hypothetical protein [Bacillus cereus]HDR8329473.1 hypothetical protein [Bacillus cereus]HDR8337559.1 hypothetical protein [Bacillus cereus]
MATYTFEPKTINDTDSEFVLKVVGNRETSIKFDVNTAVSELMESGGFTHLLPVYDNEEELLCFELHNTRGIKFTDETGVYKKQVPATSVANAMFKVMELKCGDILKLRKINRSLICEISKK